MQEQKNQNIPKFILESIIKLQDRITVDNRSFFILSSSEKKLAHLLKLLSNICLNENTNNKLKESIVSAIYKGITSLDTNVIIKLAYHFPFINTLCKLEIFKPHWLDNLTQKNSIKHTSKSANLTFTILKQSHVNRLMRSALNELNSLSNVDDQSDKLQNISNIFFLMLSYFSREKSKYAKKNCLKMINHYLQKINNMHVIQLADQYPFIEHLCKIKSLNQYWLQQSTLVIKKNLKLRKNTFKIIEQKTIDPFDLYRGFTFFFSGRRSYSKTGEINKNLIRAEKLGSIHAYRKLLKHRLTLLRKSLDEKYSNNKYETLFMNLSNTSLNTNHYIDIQDITDSFKPLISKGIEFAKLHNSIGHVLLSILYIELAHILRKYCNVNMQFNNVCIATYYELALKNLYIAKLTAVDSNVEINNFAFGTNNYLKMLQPEIQAMFGVNVSSWVEVENLFINTFALNKRKDIIFSLAKSEVTSLNLQTSVSFVKKETNKGQKVKMQRKLVMFSNSPKTEDKSAKDDMQKGYNLK